MVMPYKKLRHSIDMLLLNKVEFAPVNNLPKIGHAKLIPMVSMATTKNRTMTIISGFALLVGTLRVYFFILV